MGLLAGVKGFRRVVRKVWAKFLKGAPPEPCPEVLTLVENLKFGQAHIVRFHDVFHHLKSTESVDVDDADETETKSMPKQGADYIKTTSMRKLVKERRKWILHLQMRLFDIGGCSERLSWDHFVWITLRFCTLNRVELAQAMFLLIQTEVASTSIHYLTAEQLQGFYDFYRDCPVPSFNTKGVIFDKMPLCRFYVTDFVELTHRFDVLLNPLFDLQRVMQFHLPGHHYWDNGETQVFSRKIYFDFFIMDTSRVHLRGEPAFRETCDLLLPDALGGKPVNTEQWIMRTSHCRLGRGLRQVSAWGEQPLPEMIEQIKTQLAEEAAAAAAAEVERLEMTEHAQLVARRRAMALASRKAAEAIAVRPDSAADEAAVDAGPVDQTLPREAWPEEPQADGAGKASASTAVVSLAAGSAGAAQGRRPGEERRLPTAPAEVPEKAGPLIDAHALSLYAAALDEDFTGPVSCPPPAWMKGATTAPAPQLPAVRSFGRGTDTWSGDFGATFGRSF